MAKTKSTRAALDKGLQQIDRNLRECRQTLMCATEALEKAEDLSDLHRRHENPRRHRGTETQP